MDQTDVTHDDTNALEVGDKSSMSDLQITESKHQSTSNAKNIIHSLFQKDVPIPPKRKSNDNPKRKSLNVKKLKLNVCSPLFDPKESADIPGTLNTLLLAITSIEADLERLTKETLPRTDTAFRQKELDEYMKNL